MMRLVSSRRLHGDLDGAKQPIALAAGQRREERCQRVSRGAAERVLELDVSLEGKNVGTQREHGGATRVLGGRLQSLIGHRLDASVRILGVELGLDDGAQLDGQPAEKDDLVAVAAEGEGERQPSGVRLMDGGEGLIHVDRPALIVGRQTEGEEHRGQGERSTRGGVDRYAALRSRRESTALRRGGKSSWTVSHTR